MKFIKLDLVSIIVSSSLIVLLGIIVSLIARAAPPEHPELAPLAAETTDVAVTKYIESGTVAPGHYVKYVVEFRNESLYSATHIVIRDTLPMSATYVSSTEPGLILMQAGPDKVHWYKDQLAGFENGWASITVRFDDDAPVGAMVSNMVHIETLMDPEDNTANNDYALQSEILPPGPDLSIRKELQSGIVDGGNQISYHIRYDYTGPNLAPAHNIRITDTLPASATYVSDVNYAGFTTVITGDTVVWEKSSIPADSSGDLYLDVLIDGDFDPNQDWLENVVEISTSDAETNYDNNLNRFVVKPETDKYYAAAVTSVEDRTMRRLSDGGFDWMIYYLDWSKAEPSDNQYNWRDLDRAIWQAWRYHLKLAVRIDRAPAWARSAGSSQTAPPTNPNDLRDFVDAIADRTNVPPIAAYIIWNEPNLASEWGGNAPNAAAYMDLLEAANLGAAGRGLIVSAGLATTGNSPDSVDDRTYLQQMYDVAGAGGFFDLLGVNPMGFASAPDDTSDPNGYNFSRAEVWRQIMIDNGDGAKKMFATEVGWLRDTETDLGSYNWMKVSGIDQAHYLARAYHKARRQWPWMQAMALWNMDFAAYYPDTEHPHWFSVNGGDLSPYRSYLTLKNAATGGPADLWLEKEFVGEAKPGQNLVYRIYYNNIGGQPAAGVVLTDTFPAETEYVSDSRGDGTPLGDDRIVWDIGPVDTGARGTITLTLLWSGEIVPASNLTNTVQANILPNEPYTDDNVATAAIPLPNLSLSKSVEPASVYPGSAITYTLTFSNTGDATAKGVVITDSLPGIVTVQNIISSSDVTITDTTTTPPTIPGKCKIWPPTRVG